MAPQAPHQVVETEVVRVVVGVAADLGVEATTITTCMRLPPLKVPNMNSIPVAATMEESISKLPPLHRHSKRESAIIVCIESLSTSVSSLSARIVVHTL